MLRAALAIRSSSSGSKPVAPITRAGPPAAAHKPASSAAAAPVVKSRITSAAAIAAERSINPAPSAASRPMPPTKAKSGSAASSDKMARPMRPFAPATATLIGVVTFVPNSGEWARGGGVLSRWTQIKQGHGVDNEYDRYFP